MGRVACRVQARRREFGVTIETILMERALGPNVGALLLSDEGTTVVLWDPAIVRVTHLGLVRQWARRAVAAGWAFALLHADEVARLTS